MPSVVKEGIEVGFTGTGSSPGMTAFQKETVERLLRWLKPKAFHHGDCVWADEQADGIAQELGIYRVGHPPKNNKKRAWCRCEEERYPAEYHVRNANIVREAVVLIATPRQTEEVLRSGTWSTYRMAKRLNKPIALVLPAEMRLEGDIKL